MEIVPIFDKPLDKEFFAVRYKPDTLDEFERLFDLWREDVECLKECFENNIVNLKNLYTQNIYRAYTEAVLAKERQHGAKFDERALSRALIDTAIETTISDAANFEQVVVDYCTNGYKKKKPALIDILQPLHRVANGSYYEIKIKVPHGHSWLRLYGIVIGKKEIIITGGGIKLVKTMQESSALKEELKKIKAVKAFLKSLGVDEIDDLYE